MPVPAARFRRQWWLVSLLCLVLWTFPISLVGANQAVTPIPPQQASVAGNGDLGPCPVPGQIAILSEDAPVTDYAIVLDLSGSMMDDNNPLDGSPDDGDGDGLWDNPERVIFPKVQEAVAGFIRSVPSDANIVVIPFANGVIPGEIKRIDGVDPTSADQAVEYVTGLRADRSETHITEAVTVAIDELAQLAKATPDRAHYQTLLLYTDGIGNGPGDLDANGNSLVDELIAKIGGYRTDQPFLFVKYIALGLKVPKKGQLEQSGIDVIEEVTGEVTPIRELGLTMLGRDLGVLVPGASATTKLCASAGDVPDELGLQLSVSGIIGSPPPIDLLTDAVLLSAEGSELSWRIPDDGSARPGSYVAYLDVADGDPELFLSPERFAVKFTIAEATPTPTPIPPTSTPVPPTFTPEPTPTPLPGVAVSLGSGGDKQKVSLTDPPGKPVRWTIPVTVVPTPGAVPELIAKPPVRGDGSQTAAIAYFEVDGTKTADRIEGKGGEQVALVIETTAGDLQAGGENDPVTVSGGLAVDPKGASVTLPEGLCRPGADCGQSIDVEAKVYQPVDFRPFLFGLLGLLAIGGAAGAVYAARPALPKNAAIVTGSGRRTTSLSLTDFQRGFVPKGVSIGGSGSNLNVGVRQQLGEVHGKWGFPHKAFLTSDAGAANLKVDRQPVNPGTTVQLQDGSVIQAGNTSFKYSQ